MHSRQDTIDEEHNLSTTLSFFLNQRSIRSTSGTSHDDTRVLSGNVGRVGPLSSARPPLKSLASETAVKAACSNGKDEAPDNGNDEKGNLDRRDVFLGGIVHFVVLAGIVPVTKVKLVGVDDDFSILVVLSSLDIVNKVAHLFLVGFLLGRLKMRKADRAFKNLRSRHQR